MPPRRRDADGGGDGTAAGTSGRGAAGAATHIAPVHRFAFAQHLMKHGCVTEDKAKRVFEQLTGSDSDDLYRRLVADQNREMEKLHLKIKTINYPVDDQRYVALVNTEADAAAKFGTRYTPQELAYFRVVMEAIALDDSAEGGVGSASSIHLLNMEVRPPPQPTQPDPSAAGSSQAAAAAAAGSKMTKAAKEAALRKLVADGWLKHGSAVGHYCLGARTFLELGQQLMQLPDLPDATRAAWQDLM